MATSKVTTATFDAEVLKSSTPVLVDFWAEWCRPCRMMAPQFEAAAARMPDVRFVKLDTEAAPQTSIRYRIRSIPTMALFRQGQRLPERVERCQQRTLSDGSIKTWVSRIKKMRITEVLW